MNEYPAQSGVPDRTRVESRHPAGAVANGARLPHHARQRHGLYSEGRIVVELLSEPLRSRTFGRPTRKVKLCQLQVTQPSRAESAPGELTNHIVAAERQLLSSRLPTRVVIRDAAPSQPTSTIRTCRALGGHDHVETSLEERALPRQSLDKHSVIVRQVGQLAVELQAAALLQRTEIPTQIDRGGAHKNLQGVIQPVPERGESGQDAVEARIVFERPARAAHLPARHDTHHREAPPHSNELSR